MRLDVRLAATGLLLALLVACGGGQPASQQESGGARTAAGGERREGERTLHVYNWSDYIDPGVITDFEKATGIRVTYDVFDSNEVLETRLLAGSTGYDVVVPSASFLERQVKAGVFRPLDKSKLPNLKNLDPAILERVAQHDPGNAYAVPYMWGTSGLGYDAAAVRERLPGATLDSWRDFFDPTVLAKFADCGVSVLDAPSEVVGNVLIFLGRNANSEAPEDLQAAEQVLARIRPSVRYVNSSRYIEDLANGEICLALGWSGDVLQARDRAREAGKGIAIEYRIPKEGAMMFFDVLAIPRDARHPDEAHLFIDYLLRPDVAARDSAAVRYASGNLAAAALEKDDLRTEPAIHPEEQMRARLVPDLAKSPQFTRQLTRAWTRFKTGK